MRGIPNSFSKIINDLQRGPSPEEVKIRQSLDILAMISRQEESLTQLPQSSDYRHTIDMLQAKVWLYQATTVFCFIAAAAMGFSK